MQLQTLTQLYRGVGFKRGERTYPTTRTLIEPFIEFTEPLTDDFRITVNQPKLVSLNDFDEAANEYSAVCVEAVLKSEYTVQFREEDRYDSTFGMLYNLEAGNPQIVFYLGLLRKFCLNLNVYNAKMIKRFPISLVDNQWEKSFEILPHFLDNIEKGRQDFLDFNEKMVGRNLEKSELHHLFGYLLDNTFKKDITLDTSDVICATNLLFHPSNYNRVPNKYHRQDGKYDMYTVYNSLTAGTSKFEKVEEKRPVQASDCYQLFKTAPIWN